MSKKTTTKRFLEKHPICCFCGGDTPATSIDHVPSRQLFTLKHRPKGLEVPACGFCNSVIRQEEQIAALISRMFPDPQTIKEKEEVKAMFQAVENNWPEVLVEMKPSRNQIKKMQKSGLPGHAMNARGPLVNHSILQFVRKLTLASHYTITGNIVPKGFGVGVRWWTNFQIKTEGKPPILDQVLGPPHTLKQGTWEVGDQFFLRFRITDSQNSGMYYAGFRASFEVLGFVHPERSFLSDAKNGEVFDVFEPN